MRVWYFRNPTSIHPCAGAAVVETLDPNPGNAPATKPVTSAAQFAVAHNCNPGHLRFAAGNWIVHGWLTGNPATGHSWGWAIRIFAPPPGCAVAQLLHAPAFGPPFPGVPTLYTSTIFLPPVEIATGEILVVDISGTSGPVAMTYHYNGAIGSTSFSFLETPDFYAPGPYGRM